MQWDKRAWATNLGCLVMLARVVEGSTVDGAQMSLILPTFGPLENPVWELDIILPELRQVKFKYKFKVK